jgi:hypothetical protein
LRGLVEQPADIRITEYVAMEVLAGARSSTELSALQSLLMSYPVLPLRSLTDYEEAAELYCTCRSQGETIRKLGDCLVAVPVIRAGAELLHNDSDFDAIARHSELRIYSP